MMTKNIPPDKFKFAQANERICDEKFETKQIGYFRDALIRFKRNKASVTAFAIIVLVVVSALLTSFFSPLEMSDVDGVYSRARPRIEFFANMGFWDGGNNLTINNRNLVAIQAIGVGAESHSEVATWEQGSNSVYNPLMFIDESFISEGTELRTVRVNSYLTPGFAYITLSSMEELEEIFAWEQESGLNVVFPMINTRSQYISQFNVADANFWFRHSANSDPIDANGQPMTDLNAVMEHGLLDNYLRDGDGNIAYHRIMDLDMISIRVLYYNYYQFLNGREPRFVLGADAMGYDIMVRLANGILLSLALAFSVSFINLTIGAYLGALQGYFGGLLDLFLQRLTEIISNFPFLILYSLIAVHLVNTGRLNAFWGLILAFVVAGWIGTSFVVRMQFYRFKNEEYILAARTLGAKDNRLMFKHIFPNAIGTIITSSVLVIPFVIFTESTLSFLGIVNFDSATTSSLGSMLANGRGVLASDPHILLFPSIIVSLLMISFNLFGNGLRDAFNPSLRGTEE